LEGLQGDAVILLFGRPLQATSVTMSLLFGRDEEWAGYAEQRLAEMQKRLQED